MTEIVDVIHLPIQLPYLSRMYMVPQEFSWCTCRVDRILKVLVQHVAHAFQLCITSIDCFRAFTVCSAQNSESCNSGNGSVCACNAHSSSGLQNAACLHPTMETTERSVSVHPLAPLMFCSQADCTSVESLGDALLCSHFSA